MALSPQFLDELKHRFTLSDVVGRHVKLVRHGREHQGLCPFHNEKTPSFTVNDQKGFYHCFGCGAHGSVLDFVMGTQGMEFMEAVEMLAGEAGMEMPRQTPQQIERDKKRGTLSEAMDTVAKWYMTQLKGQVGRAAYDYIKGRGLTDETLERFGMGYAPAARTALKDAMIARGIGEDQLIETGMLIKPEDGGASYDRFRDRLMFPITDRQGRVIAFGGRALSKDAKAKYLNSPETTLFHKGATLYNWANARAASYDAGQVMVVEGYMDVIALAQYGIDYAVAPLGTALTEEQISHLWQMADEPILSFDGDNAGLRAASRAVERSLPMLKPGKSLRFIVMPEGDDPDSLVQREGKKGIEELIDKATPLVDMLWHGLIDGKSIDTPERRAGIEQVVFSKLAEIQDAAVKKLYMSEFGRRLKQYFSGYFAGSKAKPGSLPEPSEDRTEQYKEGFRDGAKATYPLAYRRGQKSGHSKGYAKGYLQGAATGLLANTAIGRRKDESAVTDATQKTLMLTLVHHPEILIKHEELVAGLEFSQPGLDSLRDALLIKASFGDTLDYEAVLNHLEGTPEMDVWNSLLKETSLRDEWFAWPDAALSDALTGFEQLVKRFQHITDARRAYEQAEAEYAENMTAESHARFVAAQQAYRELADNEADKEGYRLESGRFSFN